MIAATTEIPAWLVMSLGGILAVAGIVGSWLGLKLTAWLKKKGVDAELLEALSHGVTRAWQTIVKDAKEKAADGKLTDEEKISARANALAAAKKVATPAAKKALMKLGADAAGSLISRIADKRKKDLAK